MIIVVVGPTGVGKTKMSVELAKHYDAEIINADSMQVYKYLNIGTAKVTEEEKEGVPHHLFDICEVNDIYTVYDYQRDARSKIKELQDKNKNIIIVGGTGLYIRALLFDYKFKDEDSDELNLYEDLSNQEILNKILEYDEDCDIHVNNRKRLVRYLNKLEQDLVIENNGSTPLYDFTMIGLTTDRDTLYDKINKRVDKMVDEGLIDEVKYFYDNDVRSKAIETGIGYKELYKYFDKEISLEEALDLIKKNSRRYAKRQYTFFNNQFKDIKWYNTNYDDFSKTVEEVINDIDNKKD